MGINDENTIFLTQEEHEIYMLQRLQLDFGESFDYKQGYEISINEVHKQYNLRNKKNTKAPAKKIVQTQTKKIVEAPVTKTLQILPRETHNTFNPKIVDITSTDTQTSIVAKTSTATQIVPNKKIKSKTVETQLKY